MVKESLQLIYSLSRYKYLSETSNNIVSCKKKIYNCDVLEI